MSERGLPEPNNEPTNCFSINVRSSKLMPEPNSVAG
jgi:hypothetical protein